MAGSPSGMVGVSLFTRNALPADVTRKLLDLHLPEGVRVLD